MLERPAARAPRVWDTNSVWLAFLFLCLCWVGIMVLIIHRDVLNQALLSDLLLQRAQVATQMIPLQETEAQSAEYQNLRMRLEVLDRRIGQALLPPRHLFVLFAVFEVAFIVAFYVLLWRLRREVGSPLLWAYLATLPLGFVYFFLIFAPLHVPLVSQRLTLLVAIYFALGFVAVCAHAVVRGNRRGALAKASPGG